MKCRRKRDIFTALLFLGLGLFTIMVVIPEGVAVPSNVQQAALSPVFWPRIIVVCAIVAAFLLLVESLLIRQVAPVSEAGKEDAEAGSRLGAFAASIKTAVLIVALFAFYWSLTTLGLMVASMILIFAMTLFFGERKIWLVAVLSVAIPLLLYGFFRYVAGVPIPLGIFGG